MLPQHITLLSIWLLMLQHEVNQLQTSVQGHKGLEVYKYGRLEGRRIILLRLYMIKCKAMNVLLNKFPLNHLILVRLNY